MIAAYLIHSGICTNAEDALALFGRERTHDNKGVTIPSQIRYVHYYEALLRRNEAISYTYKITHIRFITVPNFDPSITGGGCDPYVVVKMLFPENESVSNRYKTKTVFHQYKELKKVKKYYPNEKFVNLDFTPFDLRVRGDVNLTFYDHDTYSSDDKMCSLWFNTAFVERNFLVFDKSVIDRACKDKLNRAFTSDFKVEIYLHRVENDDIHCRSYADGEDGDEEEDDDEDDDN